MAIYSLSHSAIGRTTHAAGSAGAHARYITRDSAARDRVIAEHIPTEREAAAKWFNDAEAGLRKNGRVADKLMLALPRELSAEQRMELVRDYAQQITQGGRAPWIAGIHDRGKDAANPHAHLVIHDRDIETGKRVAGLSEKGSTERLREAWELVANQHLKHAGIAERIDRRTLEAQGIKRAPQIHEGPTVRAMVDRGLTPSSQSRDVPKKATRQHPERSRIVDYPGIDAGITRLNLNAVIRYLNTGRDYDQAERMQDHIAKLRRQMATGSHWEAEGARQRASLAVAEERARSRSAAFSDALAAAYTNPEAAEMAWKKISAENGAAHAAQLVERNGEVLGALRGTVRLFGFVKDAERKAAIAALREIVPAAVAAAQAWDALSVEARAAADRVAEVRPEIAAGRLARQEFAAAATAIERAERFLKTDQADAGRHPDLQPAFERLALVQAALVSAGISGASHDDTIAQARRRIAYEFAAGRELQPIVMGPDRAELGV